MKTSNKILTIWGLVLLVSPLVFIMTYVRAHYENIGTMDHPYSTFDASSDKNVGGMEAIVTKPFSRIIINGGKSNIQMDYRLNQSNQYGVRITEGLKSVTTINVNDKGELEITIDHQFVNIPQATIDIFAPSSVDLTLKNMKYSAALYTNLDSLQVTATNSRFEVHGQKDATKNVVLVADSSTCSIYFTMLNKLSIEANNHSRISVLQGDSINVDQLYLNLGAQSKFNAVNVYAKEIFGTIAENAILEGIDRASVKKLP